MFLKYAQSDRLEEKMLYAQLSQVYPQLSPPKGTIINHETQFVFLL